MTNIPISAIDKSLLLAAFFRGNATNQELWTSCSDQVVTLSLFYTGEINFNECESRFSNRGCVGGLYQEFGELQPLIRTRYQLLVDLIRNKPQYIEGGGDFETPADTTFTACRLTDKGVQLATMIIEEFPSKPVFTNWSDERVMQ